MTGTPRDERALMEYVAGERGEWLEAYVRYARSLTDAPLAFHVGGGLVALAGAVGSNLYWYGGGAREQWPNLYVLLIGPSGTRKSTSVDIPTNALKDAVPGTILDREFSPERFIRNLAAQPNSVLKESEFASLLERMKSNYMAGMKQRLTDLYDCQDTYERVIQGVNGTGERIAIIRPALSIVAASTLEWLVDSLTETDMRSGFIPRFLIFSATQKEPEPPGGYFAPRPERISNLLLRNLQDMSRMPRWQLDFSQVRERLVAWCIDRTGEYERSNGLEEVGGLYNRLGHHTAKICALLTVSRGPIKTPEDAVVAPEIAERAIALMEWILDSTNRLFEERITFSQFELQAQRALRLINPEIEWSALVKSMRIPVHEAQSLIRTLEERGEIQTRHVVNNGVSRKVIVRLLPELRFTPRKILVPARPAAEE